MAILASRWQSHTGTGQFISGQFVPGLFVPDNLSPDNLYIGQFVPGLFVQVDSSYPPKNYSKNVWLLVAVRIAVISSEQF